LTHFSLRQRSLGSEGKSECAEHWK
jgi:hypothetical protein